MIILMEQLKCNISDTPAQELEEGVYAPMLSLRQEGHQKVLPGTRLLVLVYISNLSISYCGLAYTCSYSIESQLIDSRYSTVCKQLL